MVIQFSSFSHKDVLSEYFEYNYFIVNVHLELIQDVESWEIAQLPWLPDENGA